MKVLWFDTETTGLDPVRNDIIQIAGKVLDGQRELVKFNFTCQPFNFDNIEESALEVNERTVDELRAFEEPGKVYCELKTIFEFLVDKFDKKDKLVPAGQNVKFDIGFLYEFWKKNCDPYLFSFIGSAPLDTMQLAVMYEMLQGRKVFSSYKLEVLYQTLFGLDMPDAHDAMADIDATIKVARKLWSLVVKKDAP